MILSETDIRNIIVNNPNKALVDAGKKYNKEMRKHFYGDMLSTSLEVIEGYEKNALHALRVTYAKSNKDLFNRLSRPIDKVFSARGGSIYYNLPDAAEKKARALAMDIKGGYSIKKWIESFWRSHYLDDPYGITFIEIAETQKALQLRSQGKSFVYPTYKSIQCIYDYQPNGSGLDYVVFNVSAAEKVEYGYKPEDRIFRVVDDSYDYFVKLNEDGGTPAADGSKIASIQILKDHTFPNLFMYVPGIINSDIPDPNIEGAHLSLFDDILELANTFLMKGSIKLTHEFLFAFPKYWQYANDCEVCQGTKLHDGETCKSCNGSGKSGVLKVSDALLLTHPQTKDDPVIAPSIAGFVSPDKTYYDIATHDLQLLEDLMNFTLWGAAGAAKVSGMSTESSGPAPKTATEITTDIKPQSDRLAPISECAEKRHKFILDAIITIQISQSYQGASVNYGKRYMIESPDAIWTKYSDARSKGAAISVLDDLLLEYYEAKYNSDPVKLAIQTKLMKVEPFVHITVSQLNGLNAGEQDYKAKLYFSEWLSTLNEAIIISYSVDELRSNMYEETGKRQLAPKEQKLLPAA